MEENYRRTLARACDAQAHAVALDPLVAYLNGHALARGSACSRAWRPVRQLLPLYLLPAAAEVEDS